MVKISIRTRDGSCPTHAFLPAPSGPWPAVIVFMDGFGIRPAMLEIGERLSRYGYFVLLPDLFYRSGPYEPMSPRTVLADPAQREVLRHEFLAQATSANVMSDTHSILRYLASRPDIRHGGIGTTG